MVCLYHGSIWVFWLKRCVCLVQCLDCKVQFWDQHKRLMKNCLLLVWNYNKYFWLDHFRNSTHWIHLNRSGYSCRSYLKLQAHSDQQITFLFRVTQFFHHGFYLKEFLIAYMYEHLSVAKAELSFWFKINTESKSQWNRSVS